MKTYVITEQARLDIQERWNHIANDNVDAADKVITALQLGIQKLARMPGIGHPRADVRNSRYRFWGVYSYLIANFPDTNPLEIVRVVQGARNISQMFRR